MKVTSKLNILLLILIIHNTSSKLLHSSIIFKHGARTSGSTEYYNINEKYYLSLGKNTLTPKGYTQELFLGTYLKLRYIKGEFDEYRHFLSEEFDQDEISIKVSLAQNTIFSGFGFINGLYPHNFFTTTNTDFTMNLDGVLPPIKNYNYNVINLQHPNLLVYAGKNASFFESRKCFGEPEFTYTLDDHEKELIDSLSDKFPKEIAIIKESNYNETTVSAFFDLIDSLSSLIVDFKIEKLGENFIKMVRKFTVFKNYKFKACETAKKLYSSPILDNLLRNIKNCARNINHLNFLEEIEYSKQCFKLNVYATHGNNIVDIFNNILDEEYLNTLTELAVYDEEYFKLIVPAPAASIIFELHLIENRLYVKIFVNGEEKLRKFKNGIEYKENGLTLHEFKEIMRASTVKDYSTYDCI